MQLAAEMILQAGAHDLLAVVEIFRPDEADHRIDQQRSEFSRHRVGARLERLLVDAVMGIGGQRAALTGLEIHHVVADGAALERQRGRARLSQQREIDAEAAVGRLRSGNGLKHQIDRRAALDQRERGGHVRQHAGLGRNVEREPYLVEHRSSSA